MPSNIRINCKCTHASTIDPILVEYDTLAHAHACMHVYVTHDPCDINWGPRDA